MANPRTQELKYRWLDLLRGLAALEVFTGHLRTLFFKNYHEGHSNFIQTIFFYLTGFSHEAVIVFFVLSGFFIGRNLHLAVANKKWSAAGYGIDRITRLWVVLLPALVLTALLDYTGLHYFPGSMAYNGTVRYLGNVHVSDYLTAKDFTGNLFFLQGITVHTYGSNTPLWSLSNEFWYYVLFPLIYFAFREAKIIVKIILLAFAALVFYFVGLNISLYFIIWLMGFAVVLLHEKYNRPNKKLIWLLLIISLPLIAWVLSEIRTKGNKFIGNDFTLGALIAVLTFCLVNGDIKNKFVLKISSFFSEISYSLYAIHMPLSLLLSCWAITNPVLWTMKYFMVYLFFVALIMGITYIFWYLFESRYKKIRKQIKSIFKGREKIVEMS